MRKRQAASATRREIYEAERRRRSLAVAAASTAVVVLALIVLVPLAPGWEKVQKSFFNGAVLAKSFPRLLDAFKVNVMIFAWSAPSIAILGLLIALARGVRAPTLFPLRIFATIYTDTWPKFSARASTACIIANVRRPYLLAYRKAKQCEM
jgi:polar amino acid transport system permease protein